MFLDLQLFGTKHSFLSKNFKILVQTYFLGPKMKFNSTFFSTQSLFTWVHLSLCVGLRKCPSTCRRLSCWTAEISAVQPVKRPQVDGQVLNLPLYVGLTDTFRTTQHFFQVFASTCRPLQVDRNFRTCGKMCFPQPVDLYRLTDI